MENNAFEYTYSAQHRQEVEEIRKAYLPKEEDKMNELRKLHAVPTKKARAASIAVGMTGTLVIGTGMSLCMTEIASALGSMAISVITVLDSIYVLDYPVAMVVPAVEPTLSL